LISLRLVPLWYYLMIAIKVLQAWQQRALKDSVGQCSALRWTIQPVGFTPVASLT